MTTDDTEIQKKKEGRLLSATNKGRFRFQRKCRIAEVDDILDLDLGRRRMKRKENEREKEEGECCEDEKR